MPHFTYSANDEHGNIVTDSLDAANVHEARSVLLSRGLDVLSLTEVMKIRKESAWVVTEQTESAQHVTPSKSSMPATYFPLVDTFRLYAGWLLVWYFAIFAFGGYQAAHNVPFHVPFVDDLVSSALIAECACAVFLFLALTSMHRFFRGGVLSAILFSIIGIVLLGLFSVNL